MSTAAAAAAAMSLGGSTQRTCPVSGPDDWPAAAAAAAAGHDARADAERVRTSTLTAAGVQGRQRGSLDALV